MYPLKFENIYHKKVWGGDEFKQFRSVLPQGLLGESWDICCRRDAVSIVKNGELKGQSLQEIIEAHGIELLGRDMYDKPFPLLIKLINARDKLSVQVHPGNEYAGAHENDPGKNEFWYIMDCEPGAYVILGAHCSKNKFENVIHNRDTPFEQVESCLNRVPVKNGDIFYVSSGLIHGIGKGILLAEFQDNSDITYRLYDYGRGRDLQLEKAIDAADFSLKGGRLNCSDVIQSEGMILTIFKINERRTFCSKPEKFHTLTCVQGHGVLEYGDGIMKLNYGDSILVPADLGIYEVKGNMNLIKVDIK